MQADFLAWVENILMTSFPELALRTWKRWFSPALPAACRFVPTCSEYAAEAVATRGFFLGTLLAIWRLLRCHPFARGGYDPVPAPRESCGHSHFPLYAGDHAGHNVCSPALPANSDAPTGVPSQRRVS